MASTRAATGNSKPRVFEAISTAPGRKTTGKKRATKKTTATPTSRVTKKKAPAAKRKTSVKAKVEGAAKKIEGKVLNKPGKEAAGTKKIRGTDGKGVRKAKV